jgi:hypothetical protein
MNSFSSSAPELNIPGLGPHLSNLPDPLSDEADNKEGKFDTQSLPKLTLTFGVNNPLLKSRLQQFSGL